MNPLLSTLLADWLTSEVMTIKWTILLITQLTDGPLDRSID